MQSSQNLLPQKLSIAIDDNPTAATGVLTSNNTNVSNNDTVTINGRVYTFKTTLTGAADEVLIGASADASLTNLRTLINSGRAAVAASQTLTAAANAANTETVVIGSKTYTFKTALTEKKATGTLTSDATNPSNGDTVTIDTIVYTFVSSLVVDFHGQDRPETRPYRVLIGADSDATMNNLIAAINGATGEGTKYSLNTVAHPTVTAGTLSSNAFAVTAKSIGTAGNSIATTEASSHLSWGGATLATGANSVANEVLVGADAAASLVNLKAAINADQTAGVVGVKFSTATVASTQVTAGAIDATTLVVTAQTAGAAGNSIATTETAAQLSWGAATLAGGVTASTVNADVTCGAVAGDHSVTVTAITAGFAGNAITSTESAVTLSWGAATLAGGGSTIGTAVIPEDGGRLSQIVSIAPQWTGTPTYTIALLDSDGNQYYVTGALNENATTNTDNADLQISGGDTVKVTTSTKVEETLPIKVQLR